MKVEDIGMKEIYCSTPARGGEMAGLIIFFLLVAIVAAIFGFGGIVAAAVISP